MAVKKTTGIVPNTVRFGKGITAVRALPKGKGKRPAVIILHERYGIDQHTKDLTVRLAQAGFVGLAPDLFHRFTGDRNALQKGQARVDLRDDEALEDLNASVDYLKKLNSVDGARIGIIGVCQTGRQPLLLAAHRNDIAGAVVFTGPSAGKNGMAMRFGLTPSRNLSRRYLAPYWESSARRIILSRWTMSSASAVVWNGRRRVIMCGSTATRRTAGSTILCRDATGGRRPRMPGAS